MPSSAFLFRMIALIGFLCQIWSLYPQPPIPAQSQAVIFYRESIERSVLQFPLLQEWGLICLHPIDNRRSMATSASLTPLVRASLDGRALIFKRKSSRLVGREIRKTRVNR